jgi:hypothetical protein
LVDIFGSQNIIFQRSSYKNLKEEEAMLSMKESTPQNDLMVLKSIFPMFLFSEEPWLYTKPIL